MSIVLRIFLMLLGFLLTGVTAIMVFFLIGGPIIEAFLLNTHPELFEQGPVTEEELLLALTKVWLVMALVMQGFLVAGGVFLIAIAVGEIAGIRTWIYYVLACGAAFCLIPMFAGAPDEAVPEIGKGLAIAASCGFAGGFVYWLVAGRNAGVT